MFVATNRGYARLIDKPIIDSRKFFRVLENPFSGRMQTMRKKAGSPSFGTVLGRWFQSKTSNMEQSYDDSDYIDLGIYDTDSSNFGFIYSDDEQRGMRFRPSRDGLGQL
jgi:hypothetical protein